MSENMVQPIVPDEADENDPDDYNLLMQVEIKDMDGNRVVFEVRFHPFFGETSLWQFSEGEDGKFYLDDHFTGPELDDLVDAACAADDRISKAVLSKALLV